MRAIGSSPDEPYSLIYATLISAIGSAETSVHLTNAYFVPDPQLLAALTDAAGRGVDVKLILPSNTDFWLVFHAGRSYYADLLRGGVKIYERRDALLHSKTALIDGVWSTVGSTNLDWRSFLHNEEVNAVVLGQEFGAQMQAMFDADLAASDPITLDAWNQRPLGPRLKELAGADMGLLAVGPCVDPSASRFRASARSRGMRSARRRKGSQLNGTRTFKTLRALACAACLPFMGAGTAARADDAGANTGPAAALQARYAALKAELGQQPVPPAAPHGLEGGPGWRYGRNQCARQPSVRHRGRGAGQGHPVVRYPDPAPQHQVLSPFDRRSGNGPASQYRQEIRPAGGRRVSPGPCVSRCRRDPRPTCR